MISQKDSGRLISREDPFRSVIEAEDEREIDQWSEKLLRAGSDMRAYTAQKKVVRELVAWVREEPETRRQIVAGVVRQVRNRMDIFVHLATLLAEAS